MTPVEDIASTRDEIAKLDDEIRTARDKGDGDRQRELEKRRTEVLQRLGDQRTKLLSGSPDPFTLVDGRFPLLLLPVRLETRFAWQDEKDPKVRTFARPPGNAVPLLLVRIYPDDIHVDGFDPALTPDEVEWRRKFLKACEAGTDQPDFVAAWADLVQRAGPRRAAWIAHSARRPSVPTAADHWGRAPRAACLPDRWVATAWTAGQQVGAVGRPVQEPLDVAPDPARADPATGGLAWTTSFDTALDAGMALVVPLPVTFAAAAPVDRLVVVGAVATRDPDGSTAAFEALLDAHHYTGGLSFVRPGAATNSLVGDRVDRTTRPTPEQVFRVEGDMVPLQPPRTLTDAPNSDGAEAERLLGLTPGAFGHVEGADGLRIEAGRDIRHLLATAARGTLERLLSPALAPDDLDQATGFLVGAVDGLGPLPVLRVGDQPYGVLPVALVQADDYELDPFEKRLWGLLDALRREVWEPAATGSPRIGGPAADPTTTLLALLRSDGVARQVGFRPALGPRARAAVTNTLDRRRLRGLITARTNLADLVARLGGPPDLGLAGMALLDAAAPLTSPLVQAADAAPGDTAHDHLELLAFRPPASSFRLPDLVHEAYPGAPPDTFLFALARLALLASADRAVRSILLGAQPPAIDPDTVTAWDDELDRTSAGSTPWYPLADRLYAPTPYDPLLPMHWALLGPTPPFEAWPFLETLGTVRRLACAPDPTTTGCTPHDPGVLDVVLRSELGLLSHRLDAWITALATQRLRRLRSTPEQERGLVIGGYGVLLDIAPVALGKPLGPAELPAKERGPVFTDAGNAGYVHAPSVAHAATAAVLRSAHLGQWETAPAGDPARDAFAVDLSSRRVRNALGLLDGIREGQPLGALLGYRIERRLRDEAPEGIAAVRAVAPLVADRLTVGGPVEQVAAGNVVDAVRLVDLVGEPTPVGVENVVGPQLAGLPADRRQAVVAATVDALVEAVDALDAVADLLTAEGVFQLVRGNPARSAAAGDAISATGNPPPEPEVVTSARGGVAVTQRVAVAVPADATVPTDETGGWALTPRGALEPALERWARAHLPSPDAVEVAWAGTPGGTGAAGTATLAVLQGAASAAGRTRLRLGALDLVAGAGAAGRPGLETRLLAMARLVDPADPGAGSDPDALPAAVVPTQALLAALEAADGLRALLADSRPLLPADLVPPGNQAVAVLHGPGVAATTDRLDALAGALAATQATLLAAVAAGTSASALLDALLDADRLGVDQAAPIAALSGADPDDLPLGDLTALGRAVGSALQARLAADAAVAPPDGGDAATVAWLRERARALGGPTFWVVPGLTAPDGRSDPLAGAAPDGVDPAAAALVVTQHAGVRPGVARLDRVLATVEILHGGPPAAVVHQQPVQPGERWVALAPAPGDRVPGGRVATLAFAPLPPVAGPVAVLVADEWVDVVPNRDETTSVAFHYDAPSSAAPNVVLLGVPRANAERWSTETVVQIVDEALALARLRTVDPDLLAGTAGQLLPGLYSREHETPGTVAGLQVAALTEPATPSEPPS